jgi:hypothetical protein
LPEPEELCFVIMPFDPQLHYFYLVLRRYIEERHSIRCQRADEQILTKPFPDKIDDYIRDAKVVIADCTGRNANVFYELGIAMASGKKIILISSDPIDDAPADISHYEIISYKLDRDAEFFSRLDLALNTVLYDRYEKLYQNAVTVFKSFVKQTKVGVEQATKDEFIKQVRSAERRRGIPADDDKLATLRFLLPRIIVDSNDFDTNQAINTWIERQSINQRRVRSRSGES